MNPSRPSLEIRTELAELDEYLAGIPDYLAKVGYKAPYELRAESLRSELLLAETADYARQLDSDIQVMRFRGSWADQHVLPLDFLGSACRHLHALALSALDVLRQESADAVAQMDAHFYALPAMSGSYVLGVASKHPLARELYEIIANGLGSEPALEELQTRFAVSPCLDRTAYKALIGLVADAGVELDFSFFPRSSTRFERSVTVSTRVAHCILAVLGSTHETESETVLHGTLVGATQTKNRLELRRESGAIVSATVADSHILRGVRIGAKYSIHVHEKTVRDLVTSRETVSEVVVGLSPSVEPLETDAGESTIDGRLSSECVPEGNDLAKVYLLLKALSEGKPATPESIQVKTSRWVLYYRASARILDYVTQEGTPTRMGRSVARMRYASFLRQTALQFQISDIGAAWLDWANVWSIGELRREQAEAFLAARVKGLSTSNTKRRAGTLRKWLKVLQPYQVDESDANDDDGSV